MARRALQVIRHRPVVLVLELVLDQGGQQRRQAAELGVAEGVAAAGLGHEAAIRQVQALAGHDGAVAVFLHRFVDPGQERGLVEGDLGKQDDLRRLAVLFRRQAAGRRDPAGVAPHHFQDEHLGRGLGHRGDVVAGLADRHGHVLGHRAEAGAGVGDRQVVVHRLGDVDGLDRIAQLLAQLAHLEAGVGGVAAAVVEEVADVVGLEHLDQALVLGLVLVEALELVAAGAEGAGRSVAQRGDHRRGLLRGIDQVLGKGADDAVAAGINLADLALVLARALDQAGGGSVDDGGNPAGLGIKGIAWHRFSGLRVVVGGGSDGAQSSGGRVLAHYSYRCPVSGQNRTGPR